MNDLFNTLMQVFAVIATIGLQFIVWGTFIAALVLIGRAVGRTRQAAWKKFAAAHGLTFRPGSFSLTGARIVGVYRGRDLKIEAYHEGKVTYTRVKLEANSSGSAQPGESATDAPASPTPQEVLNLLMPNGPLGTTGGKVEATAGGQSLSFQHAGIMTNTDEMHCACNLLSDVLDGYPVVAAIGGTAVSALQTISRQNGLLSGVAIRLMKDIAWLTERQLGSRAGHLLCPRCLAHFYAHRADLPWQFDETYYGCRLCYQSREFIDCPKGVVAVLDSGWTDAQDLQDGLLRVNWLARRALFDFTAVEIVQATDEDVERFAVQVGNDADPLRRPLFASMRCVVNPACGLSENTLRILENTFGRVETLELARDYGSAAGSHGDGELGSMDGLHLPPGARGQTADLGASGQGRGRLETTDREKLAGLADLEGHAR
jgi:hypothetical protein